MTVVSTLRAELASATSALLDTAAALRDEDLAAPSLLPGWTRGHVLTHVARNADSLVNLLTWARTGVRVPQYVSDAARDAEIEAGARRPAAEQLADLRESSERLDAVVGRMPREAWGSPVEALRPPPHPAWYVLVRRLRELGMHHVDLGAGYGPADWPRRFVLRELHDCLRCWPYERSAVSAIRLLDVPDGGTLPALWPELGAGPVVEGRPADMLAWLTGRSAGEGVRVVLEGQSSVPGPAGPALPAAPPWLTMPAPADLPATPPEDYP
ncbi:maleylpyruvate isomerase family mycothiol-dependent enzyme [Nonomuraea rhodomycinica]|uniref:Maleylpyruvate isomerase family mycothiol-dependent enzyme n=1 Tax=Nonomuraea rhodomycinica TaxID=1712872 RepID=A0A7Y6IPA3_9ACTN|nr:maleylpyruvate isomerase family mycothiol-dependent enzyme [Nonomuraea rhodomycinica]NUW41608.1 maleylpyruvate isomerase family mycothiol-dependent enzyme [Nonomuraea rhodomycinica]